VEAAEQSLSKSQVGMPQMRTYLGKLKKPAAAAAAASNRQAGHRQQAQNWMGMS